MSLNPADDRPQDEPFSVSEEDILAWEERVEKAAQMTWDEFVQSLEDGEEGGLAFGGV